MTPEDKALCRRYTEMKNFRDMITKSKTLTYQQKATLWGQARAGDLDGAMKGYRKLVKVGRDDDE